MCRAFASALLLPALCMLTRAPLPAANDVRPNFLFIAIDDLKPILGHLSEEPNNFLSEIYPDPKKRAEISRLISPNLDRLASQGVDFRRAYCPAPLCNPSRTATLTGIATRHSGITINADNFRQSDKAFVRDAVTLPQNLRKHGYYTAGSGKIFHTGSVLLSPEGKLLKDWPDMAYSWDVWINGEGDGTERGQVTRSPWCIEDRLFHFGMTTARAIGMDDYQKADLIGRALENGRVTAMDKKMREEKTIALPSDAPFFLACGIFRPHLPWVIPQEFLDLFKADDIQITRAYHDANVADTRDLPPGAFQFIERRRDDPEAGERRFSLMLERGLQRDAQDGDLKAWREMIRHYLAAIAFADRCVGRLLDALDHSKYAENTVVVLWSDHGWDLGVKVRAGKVALWESTTACVLMVRDPRTPAAARGRPSYAPVSLQDLYRTLCGRAGVPSPEYVDGRDINSLVLNPTAAWDEVPITTQGARNHTLRNETFRYIRYADARGNEELYDERTDPREHDNLINDPALQSVRAAFARQLDERLASGPFPYNTGDGKERKSVDN